jgi:hypothetical protein
VTLRSWLAPLRLGATHFVGVDVSEMAPAPCFWIFVAAFFGSGRMPIFDAWDVRLESRQLF